MTLDPSSGLYFPSLTYAHHPIWSMVFRAMEITNNVGGISLKSPSLDDLFFMPLSSLNFDPATNSTGPSRGYVGG